MSHEVLVVAGKGLIEPKVAPPGEGHAIPEPHV